MLSAPTASGKTALALQLGARFPLEVVSADAFLVYRHLDVGTAKPTPEERAKVAHHVVDVREPWESYDVAQYVRDAEAAILDILARGRLPLVVGGSGFYLSALMGGLPTTPRADPHTQREIEAELAERGLDALLAQIAAVRPEEVSRLQRNPRRVVRALEIYRRTGRFPSQFPRTPPRFQYALTAYAPPPEVLEARIAARVDAMFAAGLAEEVRGVLAWLAGRNGPALQAIGYKQVVAHLAGELSLQQARQDVVRATGAYAKRQLTWLRTQLRADLLLGEMGAERALHAALQSALRP